MNVLIFASLITFPSLLSSAPAGEKNSKESYKVCNTSVCIQREVPTKGDQIPVLRRLMNESGFCLWPRTSCEDTEAPKIGNCTDELATIPIRALFTMHVAGDLKEQKSYIIELDQPTFPFVSRNELIYQDDPENEETIEAYKELVITALKIMKEDAQDEELLYLADRLVEFEGQFANLTAPPERRRDYLNIYDITNIGELENAFPNIPLLGMLNQQFSRVNITLNQSEAIEVVCGEYYENLNDFLETADCDMLYDYAGLRMVLHWADSASEEFRNAFLNLANVSTFVNYTERWEDCIPELNDVMPEITGYLYVQEKFSQEAKREVKDLVERIKAVFNETIRQVNWTHDKTKAAAQHQEAAIFGKTA